MCCLEAVVFCYRENAKEAFTTTEVIVPEKNKIKLMPQYFKDRNKKIYFHTITGNVCDFKGAVSWVFLLQYYNILLCLIFNNRLCFVFHFHSLYCRAQICIYSKFLFLVWIITYKIGIIDPRLYCNMSVSYKTKLICPRK